MKRMMLICIFLLLLTACIHDNEAKQLKNSEKTQTEIETAIKEHAKQNYGIDVEVQINELGFAFPEGKMLFPIKTDKRLVVPVQTVGTPVYDFPVYFPIYDEDREKYEFNPNDIELERLPRMRMDLLTDVFKELYKEELNLIKELDKGIEVTVTVKDELSNRAFENEEERQRLIMDFADDYNDGKFANPKAYESLLKKHAALPDENTLIYEDQMTGTKPCTPEISLSLEHEEDGEQTLQEKLNLITEFIENETTLPNGVYSIHLREADPEHYYDQERGFESVVKCE